jgi:hypothetical protein
MAIFRSFFSPATVAVGLLTACTCLVGCGGGEGQGGEIDRSIDANTSPNEAETEAGNVSDGPDDTGTKLAADADSLKDGVADAQGNADAADGQEQADVSSESGSNDSSIDVSPASQGPEASLADGPTDAGNDVGGCRPGSSCVNETNGSQGVCTVLGGACGACDNSPLGDGTCAAAYGSQFICTDGACTRGVCSTSADCDVGTGTQGKLCQSGRCVSCAVDFQCVTDAYYEAHFAHADSSVMCKVSTGQCTSAACNQASTLCSVAPNTNGNASDVCCPAQGGNVCSAGQCCQDSDCPLRQLCSGQTCTSACDASFTGAVLVDPINGIDDNVSNGSLRCAFKSLTHALAAIVQAGNGGQITIVNDQSAPTLGTSTGEVFPISVPPLVTIGVLSPGQNIPTLVVPAGQTGIIAPHSGLQLSSLIVDGQSQQAAIGIAISGGAETDNNQSSIDHVTVQGMLNAGITIGYSPAQGASPGTVTLGPGVVAQHNGTSSTPAPGLRVYGQTNVTVNGGGGPDHSSFSGNSQYGIVVTDQAFLSVSGSPIDPSNPDVNDIDTDGNGTAGLWIAQAIATVPSSNLNGIAGLHSSGNPVGLEITAGSYMQLRDSYLGNDTLAGLLIASSGAGIADLTTIDLGTRIDANYGLNVFVADGSAAAGICLQLGGPARTLVAAGNIFGDTDCSQSTGTLRRSLACANTDIGGLSPTDETTIDVSNCN